MPSKNHQQRIGKGRGEKETESESIWGSGRRGLSIKGSQNDSGGLAEISERGGKAPNQSMILREK